MTELVLYYFSASLLVLLGLICWVGTLLGLPGNWIIACFAVLFGILYPSEEGSGISITTVVALIVLAALGELVEFMASAAGAAKGGASKRSIVLAVVGTTIGSVVGAIVGVPVPVVGSIIAAVLGGGIGAFAGAFAGEIWKGRTADDGIRVGQAAMVGRILGTGGKLVLGVIMVIVLAVDAFF